MILSAIPKLPFIEKQATQNFYINLLGFEMISDYGDYFLLSLDQAELHFFEFQTIKPDKSDFMIYLRIDNGIDSYYQKIQDQGTVIHPNGPLELKAWGQWEFSVIDPNGTLLTFGQANH